MNKDKKILISNLKLSSISLNAFELFLNAINNIPARNINFTENLRRCNLIKLIEQAIEDEKEIVEFSFNDYTLLLSLIDEMTINEISYELAAFWNVLINKINE